jgi:lysophospholipase L1-like esterase
MARWTLVAAALVVALGLNELALRAFWRNPFAHEVPERVVTLRAQHARTDHELDRRALGMQPESVRFRTDERGYIEPTRRVADPEFTVVFQGGSTTECMVVDEELRWPHRVSVELEQRGFRVNALNAGRSGATAHDALVNLVQFVVEDRPDVAVLMNGINDVGLLVTTGYAPRTAKPDGWRAGARWLLQEGSARSSLLGLVRKAVLVERIERERESDAPLAMPRPAPTRPFEQRVRAWVRTCRAFGIEPVLMTEPLSAMRNELTPEWADEGGLEEFNAVLRRVAAEERATLVDLAVLVTREPDWSAPDRLFYDGMHVNDHGSQVYGRLVADELARGLLPRLRETRASR